MNRRITTRPRSRLGRGTIWSVVLNPVIAASTEAVIWMGMRL